MAVALEILTVTCPPEKSAAWRTERACTQISVSSYESRTLAQLQMGMLNAIV